MKSSAGQTQLQCLPNKTAAAKKMAKRVEPYMGLPTVDDVVTTQTNDVWRDKLQREERCARLSGHTPAPHRRSAEDACLATLHRSKIEWHRRWGNTFGVGSRPPSSGYERRPIRSPLQLPPPGRPMRLVEPTQSSLRYDAATLEAQGAAMRWDTTKGDGRVVRAAQPSEGGRSLRSDRSGAASAAPTGASGLTGASRASVVPSVRAVSISGSAADRNELLQSRKLQLQRQLEQVDQLLKANVPTTQRSVLAMDLDGPPAAAPEGAPAQLRLSTPSPSLMKKHQMAFVDAKAQAPRPLMPLCMDPKQIKHSMARRASVKRGGSAAGPLARLPCPRACRSLPAILRRPQETVTGVAMALPGRYFAAGGMPDP